MRTMVEWVMGKIQRLLIAVVLCAVGLFCCWQATVSAVDSPQTVVQQFYQWYLQNQSRARERINQQRSAFTPQFYQQLTQAFQKQPGDGKWLDFDPFSNTQVSAYRFVVKSVRLSPQNNRSAEVNIEVYADLRPPGRPVPIKVLVDRTGDRWQIRNLV
ncbi:MAG: YbjP/YqhG family protein, partial [Cyanobacteria bacterium]|nr:YbjP/YqhG family protein [Cyanobacteriota bacterium]